MKYRVVFIGIMVFILSCTEKNCDCEKLASEYSEQPEDKLEYDSLYAAELGADEYGMKAYVMAFLRSGPNQDLDSAESAELQIGHMENINRLAEEGKLYLAGPFYGEEAGDLRGLYLFDATMEEAEELTRTDPAVEAGVFVMELIPWYGSAALKEVSDLHKKAAKIEI